MSLLILVFLCLSSAFKPLTTYRVSSLAPSMIQVPKASKVKSKFEKSSLNFKIKNKNVNNSLGPGYSKNNIDLLSIVFKTHSKKGELSYAGNFNSLLDFLLCFMFYVFYPMLMLTTVIY